MNSVSSWGVTDLSVTPWLQITGKGNLQITVHVQPGAKTTSCAGVHGDALKIRLHAPPVDGKANEELVALVARHFGCSKSAVRIKSGAASRLKRVQVDGID